MHHHFGAGFPLFKPIKLERPLISVNLINLLGKIVLPIRPILQRPLVLLVPWNR
jgi:hypothetical protein